MVKDERGIYIWLQEKEKKMELNDAFKLVLELAENSILTEEMCLGDKVLLEERNKQMEAVDQVEVFVDQLEEASN